MTLLAGFAGGLAGTLWGSSVSAALLARRAELRAAGWVPETTWQVLQTAALYGACGAAAGLLFWLGWGLAAFNASPWYLVGAAYGLLLWAGATLPALLLLGGRMPGLRAAAAIMALEAFVATQAVGMLCALAWQRAA